MASTSSLLLLAALAALVGLHVAAAQQWTRVGLSEYYWSKANGETKRTFAKAVERCQQLGGHLATATDAAENRAIFDATLPLSTNRRWLGARRNVSASTVAPFTWYWIDGTPFTIFNDPQYTALTCTDAIPDNECLFSVGEPNNLGGLEYCITMGTKDTVRTNAPVWNDETCTRSLNFVCERAAPSCASTSISIANSVNDCDQLTAIGGSCTATCSAGYTQRSGTSNTLVCLESGQFSSDLACDPLECGDVPSELFVSAFAACPSETPVGSECTVSCQPGFAGVDTTISCGVDGEWDGTAINCTAVTCDPVAAGAFGSDLNQESNCTDTAGFQEACMTTCATGFTRSIAEVEYVCTETGFETSTTVESCVTITCPLPNVTNAAPQCTGTTFGDVCTFSCDEGFFPDSGSTVYQCGESGIFEPLDGELVCDLLMCPQTLPFSTPGEAGATQCQSRYVGDSCTFVGCSIYNSLAFGAEDVWTCDITGTWQNPNADTVVCSPLECSDVQLENILTSLGLLDTGANHTCETSIVNDTCTGECAPGFYSPEPISLECTILDWAVTSGQVCQPVTCAVDDIVSSGSMYSCVGESGVGGNCTGSCIDGFKPAGTGSPVALCGIDGTWTIENECVAVECSTMIGADIVVACGTAVGTVCPLDCEVGFNPSVEGGNATCVTPAGCSTDPDCEGVWENVPSDFACTIQECGAAPNVTDVVITCDSTSLVFGESCTLSCPTGFEPVSGSNGVLECGEGGVFTGLDEFACQPQSCSEQPTLPFGASVSCTGTSSGSTCEATCDSSLVASGNSTFVCDGGQWIGGCDFVCVPSELGWHVYGDSVYFDGRMLGVQTSFADARVLCQALQIPMDLVVITSAEENQFVSLLNPNPRNSRWIGATRDTSVGSSTVSPFTWMWVDETPYVENLFWGPGEPSSNTATELCAVMGYRQATDNGQWNDETCTTTQDFVCEYNAGTACSSMESSTMMMSTSVPVTTVPTTTVPTTTTTTTTTQATTTSTTTTSSVVVLPGECAPFVAPPHSTVSCSGRTEGDVCTAVCDSDVVAYGGVGEYVCRNGQWTGGCGFVCSAWDMYNNSLYYTSTVDSTAAVTFEQARALCQAEGADLASIHSPEENQFVFNMDPVPSHTRWIGLRKINGSFAFVDGTVYDYETEFPGCFESNPAPSSNECGWAVNEPNNLDSDENCVHMGLRKVFFPVWNDEECARTMGYVCKLTLEECPVTTTPTTTPTTTMTTTATTTMTTTATTTPTTTMTSTPTTTPTTTMTTTPTTTPTTPSTTTTPEPVLCTSPPTDLPSGAVFPCEQGINSVGQVDTCTATCGEGFTAVGFGTYTCGSDGLWTGGCGFHCLPDTFVTFGGSAYFDSFLAGEDKRNFRSAQAFCQDAGGELVTIETDEENLWLARRVELESPRWINLERNFSGRATPPFSWTWNSGVEYVELNWWSEGEPNYYLERESCGELHSPNNLELGGWNDAPCTDQEHFICEFNLALIAPECVTTTAPPTTTTTVPTTTTTVPTTTTVTTTTTTAPVCGRSTLVAVSPAPPSTEKGNRFQAVLDESARAVPRFSVRRDRIELSDFVQQCQCVCFAAIDCIAFYVQQLSSAYYCTAMTFTGGIVDNSVHVSWSYMLNRTQMPMVWLLSLQQRPPCSLTMHPKDAVHIALLISFSRCFSQNSPPFSTRPLAYQKSAPVQTWRAISPHSKTWCS